MDFSEYIKPYRKIQAAEELIESNSLLNHYITCYKKKYRTDPVFSLDNAHLTTIKDIQKMGKNKAFQLVEHFFQIDPDGWFSRNGHSLKCLKGSLHQVNSSLGKKMPAPDSNDLAIQLHYACTKCGVRQLMEVNSSQLDQPEILCANCKIGTQCHK